MTAEDLRALRERLGLSQAALAPLLGMERSELARLESGERGFTKKHVALIRCLRLVADHGLVGELQERIADE